jgi:hypothetical protein
MRQQRYFEVADRLRKTLDRELVFTFDHKDYQEVHYLTEAYFKKMDHNKFKTKREYVEHRLRQDRKSEQTLNAWIYSNTAR